VDWACDDHALAVADDRCPEIARRTMAHSSAGLDRRNLIPAMILCAAVALILCAVAPTLPLLIAAVSLLGLTTVGGQLLTPLASDRHRGRVVGTVVFGIMTGILVSRTISGLVAARAGWRSVYLGAAIFDTILAVILVVAIPKLPTRPPRLYRDLVVSIGRIIRADRPVRWTLVLASIAFGLFTMFWTSLTSC
jgi:MFS family permease